MSRESDDAAAAAMRPKTPEQVIEQLRADNRELRERLDLVRWALEPFAARMCEVETALSGPCGSCDTCRAHFAVASLVPY